MSSRTGDLCNFKLSGGPIKLCERPSSGSQSSNSKRRFLPKFSSRPSSAIPRLCSNDSMQDDSSLKNDQRPFSADFGIPTLLMPGKSKDTLTDGSFESVYVSVDFELASSNLFKELLEENVDDWQKHEKNDVENSPHVEPRKNDLIEEVEQEIETKIEEIPNQMNDKSINYPTKEFVPTKEVSSEDKYVLAPGLTSKPPLPKKLQPSTSTSDEFEKIQGDAIYDYFAIKYNLDSVDTNYCKEIAEESIPEEINLNGDTDRDINSDNKDKSSRIIDEQSPEDDLNLLTLKHWLDEVVEEKESETDKYMKKVKDQCKTEDDVDDLPLLSEIDIDDLFKLESKSIVPDQNTKTVPKNIKKTKVASKKSQISKTIHDKSKKNKSFNKKFTDTPIKLSGHSPRHGIKDEHVETWIGKETDERNDDSIRKRTDEFLLLIDKVEDLKSTTEISSDVPVITVPDKQENFDDLETIIEALENQDKTSQNNIKAIKKIVTSELSNSIILNEDEENVLFRKEIVKSVHLEDSIEQNARNEPVVSERDNHRNQDICTKTMQNQQTYGEGDAVKSSRCNGIHYYKELLTYLDEVDKKCTKTLEVAKERAQTASKLVLDSTSLFDSIPKVEDLLTYSSEELASYIIDLSLRVKDKSSSIGLLQAELTSLREKILNQSKQAETVLRQKMKEQKEDTERITKRHQKFIDQLMEEKKTLARRCEELVQEMTVVEDKYVANMKAIEHKYQVEMQKMKDMHAASERLRRERWIEGRTQKIKEMAVKSIEPEVERMEKRHQDELSNLRALHKREIEELELRAARKLQEHCENLREQLIQDREKALAHERDIMRLRYEKLVESEERNYQEQRRRLQADYANRVAECEEREAQAMAEKERAIKQAQVEFEEKLQVAARRHANEMKLVKESAAIEIENWKNSFRKQQSALLMDKETSIRRECRKERDKEIEMVIERLENEANKAKTQMEQTTENRIKRIRDKYEAEIRDLEMLEKDAQNKYCDARSKLLEYEDVILTLRTSMKQLETQLTEENLKRSKLESEQEEIRRTIRKEYEDKMQSLECEVEELRTSADKQVEQLYSRVRVSLARKDELLAELTTDHKALKEKCIYLENLMEQQRKDFMINT